ncbi:hypothetical protein GA707_20410 [Nostocoides sp. F2B08]|uniref:hypothetical protein n=1 Tax=Nostocoides sp. F2B08 TaxID=2653936 RepID=UPI001263C1F1|nr:hypothetical protein [Tetrasphaera sp. F2B08]KAB7739380.1 hypothetical protein GA707_20410 [Tetrasphaera sp. F2B08]
MPRSERAAGAGSGAAGPPTSTRLIAVWLGALVMVFAVWVSGLLVPYFVNDLHRLPLEEVAGGMHDPKDLWPYASGSILGAVLRLALLTIALPLTPILGIGSAVFGTGLLLIPSRRQRLTASARTLTAAAVVLGLTMAAVSLSPFGYALTAWALD